MSEDWRHEAACKDTELDFYDLHDDTLEKVRKTPPASVTDPLTLLCGVCPVAAECAAYSVRPGAVELYGFWAGMAPGPRISLANRHHDPVPLILEHLRHEYGRAVARSSQTTLEEVV